jgi:hypothetical protein
MAVQTKLFEPKPVRKICPNKVLFNFQHHYYKLDQPRFTTIRSVHYADERDIHPGDPGWTTLNFVRFKYIKLVRWEDRAIQDLPLELLQEDVAYGDFRIHSHEDFVTGINGILEDSKIAVKGNHRLTTVKRVFYCQVVEPK